MATITGTDLGDVLTGRINPLTKLAESDTVFGKAGIDRFVLAKSIGSYSVTYDPVAARYRIVGPEGTDTLSGVELVQVSSALLPLGSFITLEDPVFTGVPSVGASSGDNLLRGTREADYLNGGSGNDQIAGGKGDDWLFGSFGRDTLLGGEGDDHLEGQYGNDLLYGGAGDDLLRGDLVGQSGNDLLSGGAGNDELWGGMGDDFLDGGGENDKLTGGFGADVLRGGFGDDLLIGDQYTSRYYQTTADPDGPPNDDVLLGGEGADSLMGGVGADVLAGGRAKDRFIVTGTSESTVSAPDFILDFGGAVVAAAAASGPVDYSLSGHDRDVIDVSEIDAVSETAQVNDTFAFVGTDAFTAAGQLRYGGNGVISYVEGNVDDDLTPDFRIELKILNYTFSEYDFFL